MENNSLNHPIDKTQPNGQSTRLLSNIDVGAVPLTLFIGIAAIVALSASAGLLPKNMIGGLAVIMTLGFALAKIGRMVPVLKDIGGPAILCLMMPSVLVYFGVFEAHTLDTVHLLMKEANLLYFVIACLVVGSILGMNRTILIQGMVRMFVPLVAGTGAAILTGLLVGSLFGYSIYHTFFFIIVPIIGGGIGEGILPLSLAYSAILGQTPDVYVAQLAPAAVVGNIFAIICAGFLARMGARRPALSGNGMLIRSHDDNSVFAQHQSYPAHRFSADGRRVADDLRVFHRRWSAGEGGAYSRAGADDSGGRLLQIYQRYPGGDGAGGAQLLQVCLRRAGVAADDRPGHAVCAAGERGLGLLRWLRRGLRLHRYCHGAERFLYRCSPEYVSGGSRHCDQLP